MLKELRYYAASVPLITQVCTPSEKAAQKAERYPSSVLEARCKILVKNTLGGIA